MKYTRKIALIVKRRGGRERKNGWEGGRKREYHWGRMDKIGTSEFSRDKGDKVRKISEMRPYYPHMFV